MVEVVDAVDAVEVVDEPRSDTDQDTRVCVIGQNLSQWTLKSHNIRFLKNHQRF